MSNVYMKFGLQTDMPGQGDDDENGTVAAMAELQLKSGVPDLLTLEELAVHLATARAKYHKNTTV